MTVEILEFEVAPGRRSEFIRQNEKTWTPALRQRPGFLGREILVSAEDEDLVVILIRWSTRQAVEAFPEREEEALDEKMHGLVRERRQLLLEQLPPDDPEAAV